MQRHLGHALSEAQQVAWERICRLLIDSALAQPRVLVHRDYMPRNLMISEPNPGVLDFQDAVLGPVSYDITSLFKDAFLSWPEPQVRAWLEACGAVPVRRRGAARVVRGIPARQRSDGVQRHLKVIGIFARICHRDGKPVISPMCRVSSPISRPCWRGGRLGELQQLIAELPEAPQA